MSRADVKQATCEGKQGFASAALAHQIAGRRTKSARRRDKPKVVADIYRCQFCGCWHLGRNFGGGQ